MPPVGLFFASVAAANAVRPEATSWDRAMLEQTLNDLGSQGWEVTATMEETLVLKRPRVVDEA